MKKVTRTVTSIINNEAKEFSFYTIVNRAIPSMVDGFKPSQRFVLYSSIKNASTTLKKSAMVCGIVSDYGYAHGEGSLYDVAALMAADWSNNYPVLEGEGNFGSRAVTDAAEPRYIFSKLNKNFHLLFKDNDILLPNEISSYHTPKIYFPVIPFVLINGVTGIAVAYSTSILPHDIFSVIDECISYVKTGKCKNPTLKFPSFIGKINTDDEQWTVEGLYELQGKTKLIIKEIPLGFDRMKYVSLLNKLVANDQVVGYDEIDGEGCFTFRVTLKRDFDTSDENIIKQFGLRENIHQNIVTIGPDSNMVTGEMDLRKYDTSSDLIKDFVDYRMTVVDRRIKNMIDRLEKEIPELLARVEFIYMAREDKLLDFNQPKKKLVEQVRGLLSTDEVKVFADKVVGMPIFNMTTDEIDRLEKEYNKAKNELEYWKTTNSKKEYIKDLTTLKSELNKDK